MSTSKQLSQSNLERVLKREDLLLVIFLGQEGFHHQQQEEGVGGDPAIVHQRDPEAAHFVAQLKVGKFRIFFPSN